MTNDIALALLKAREAASLSQGDVAQLLGISQSVLSKIESGAQPPSIRLAAALTILYDKPFEGLFHELVDTMQAELAAQFLSAHVTLKDIQPGTSRSVTLQRLRKRLQVDTSCEGAND